MSVAAIRARSMVRLGDVCETTSGGTPSRARADFYGGGIPWVKSGELRDGYVTAAEESLTELGVASSSAKLLPAGTLLIAMYGATVGRVGILAIPAATNQAVCAILPNESVSTEYLFWFLQHCRPQLVEASFGGAQPNISQQVVRNISFPLLPLEEQQRTTDVVRARLAEVEKARKSVVAQLDAAQYLLSIRLRKLFQDLSDGSRKQVLGRLLTLRKEVIHPADSPTGQSVFVGLEHVESGTGRRLGSLPVDLAALTGRKPRFYKGDIVYGYLRPYLNKVWIADFDGLCSVDQYVYSVDPKQANPEFVGWFMRSSVYLKAASITYMPGQLPRVRLDEVAAVEIPLPDVPKQRAIVEDIEKYAKTCSRLMTALHDRLLAIELYRTAILRAAFNGEL